MTGVQTCALPISQGRKWLAFGEKLLWREFAEQVLSDGGHYERSTMYHALCLADFLECYALIQAFSEEGKWASFALRTKDVATKLKAMASFLQMMSYADDSLALFNDSGNSDEARPFPLLETAQWILREAPVSNTQSFPETGYFIWQSADQSDHLIVDGGVPAVHYNLAHAHCDLLSYELRLGGHPFIVDSGVHGYGGDPYREYSRSTRAHNTVMFDEQEQSEVWDTFRMGRTALPVRAAVQGSAAEWEFCGAYRSSQDQSFEHERRIRIDADGSFVIEDRVTKGQPQQARSYIHLHPMVNAIFQTDGGRKVICKFSSQIIQIEPYNECDALLVTGSLSPIQGWYFPDFGVAQASPTICFTYQVSKAQLFGYRIRKLQ